MVVLTYATAGPWTPRPLHTAAPLLQVSLTCWSLCYVRRVLSLALNVRRAKRVRPMHGCSGTRSVECASLKGGEAVKGSAAKIYPSALISSRNSVTTSLAPFLSHYIPRRPTVLRTSFWVLAQRLCFCQEGGLTPLVRLRALFERCYFLAMFQMCWMYLHLPLPSL